MKGDEVEPVQSSSAAADSTGVRRNNSVADLPGLPLPSYPITCLVVEANGQLAARGREEGVVEARVRHVMHARRQQQRERLHLLQVGAQPASRERVVAALQYLRAVQRVVVCGRRAWAAGGGTHRPMASGRAGRVEVVWCGAAATE